ncbi:hypothetical protein MRBLMD1_002769 [Pseudarthrobacter sp. LMD1-1-1.1]
MQDVGWQAWADDGGTAGLGNRIEAARFLFAPLTG